jgi:hypothetical protein
MMKELTRDEAIDDIREVLLGLVDEKNSVCKVVGDLGIFCGGFARWSFDELQERFPWSVAQHPDLSRAELEALANRWFATRQSRRHGRVTCDLMQRAPTRKPCAGWDEWYESELAQFHRDLLGDEVRVVPNALSAQSSVRPVPGSRDQKRARRETRYPALS